MTQVHATLVDGVIVPDVPLPLPDGTRLLVTAAQAEPLQMMTEDEQGDDPESIERWCAWVDSLEPLILTPGDEERIRKAREEQKAFEIANWDARANALRKLFE